MKVLSTIIIALVVGFFMVVGCYYFLIRQVDFMGNRDPESVAASNQRITNRLFSAAYRDGTDYCEVDIMDSTLIEVKVGDDAGGVMLEGTYRISGDTIVLVEGVRYAGKYLRSDKLLILDNKLLFRVDSLGNYDTAVAMAIGFNELNMH